MSPGFRLLISASTGAPGGLGLFRWCKRTNKGYDSGNASYATCYGRRDQPGTPATIDELIFFVSHHTPHF